MVSGKQITLALLLSLCVLILGSGIYTHVSNDVYFGELKARKIYRDFRQFELALSFYEKEHGRLPPEASGLGALLPKSNSDSEFSRRGFILTLDNDPWGRPYYYREILGNEENEFELLTYGSDGTLGGEGLAIDCTNTEASKARCMSEHTLSKERSNKFVAIWSGSILIGAVALPGVPLYIVGIMLRWRREEDTFVGYHLFAFLYVMLLFLLLALISRVRW